MPCEGTQLVIDDKYPFAKAWETVNRTTARSNGFRVCSNENVVENSYFVNTFWSVKLRSNVHIYNENGKTKWYFTPGIHHFVYDLETLGCVPVWGLEAEFTALQTLSTLINHHQMRCYLMTGSFLESSKRSKVTYMFRRLKPTVAMSGATGDMRILCCLCLHPIAYYKGSWAGAMAPTDDVIAHLMLMRGDEHMFWRRANQHAPHLPEAGL